MRLEDPVTSPARLGLILRNAPADAALDAGVNAAAAVELERDPAWKDGQIYGDGPQPSAGNAGAYARVDPDQRLLRLEYSVEPTSFVRGMNTVSVRAAHASGKVAVEKVEVLVTGEPDPAPASS